MKKISLILFSIIAFLYAGLCVWFYFQQEGALFSKVKISQDHKYTFDCDFEERSIPVEENINLHGVLFKAKESKGLILWLPGGRGMIDSIGKNAHYYTDLNYDLFVINFRGYGKSDGKIENEMTFHSDMQQVYDYFKQQYTESSIVIFGYSLGTGPTASLASRNKPKILILKAPYFSMVELAQKAMPYLPMALLLKYKFSTNEHLQNTQCPVYIIHGEDDNNIPVDVSYRLQGALKPTDKLIVLKDQGHNDFVKNPDYLNQLSEILH